MKAAKKSATAKPVPLGECCPVLDIVLRRDCAKKAREGFEIATPFGLNDGKPRPELIIYRFRKGKKDDPREIADEVSYRDVTHAQALFCPFCGAKLERAAS